MDKAIYCVLFCLLISSALALKTDFTCSRQPKRNVDFVDETIIAIDSPDSPDFCKFTKNDKLTVTLRSVGGEVFHAFILQAETPDHLIIGSWSQTTPHKVETCSGAMDTITNQGYDPLNKIDVEWVAPKFFSHQQIEFVASVMANGTTWYSSRSQICYYEEPHTDEEESVGYTEIHDPKTEDDTESKTPEEEEDYEREEATSGPDPSEQVGDDETEGEEDEAIRRDDAGNDNPDETEQDDDEEDVDDGEYDEEEDDDEPMDTDHDQALEDDLAAREAMKEQEDADEEDRKSEREAYQKKKMEEEQEHRDEIEKEREDFERAQAEEEEERQRRIRIEIIDKENFDRMKAEEEREAAEDANRPMEKKTDEIALNQVNPNSQDEDKKHGKGGSGGNVVRVGGLCLALAILRMFL